MENIRKLFEKYSGCRWDSASALPSSGGKRKYYRIRFSGKSCIAATGDDITENKAFIYMAGHFRSAGLPVPEILAVSDDYSCYLQEDLGDTTLFSAVGKGRECGTYSDEEVSLLKNAVAVLPDFQVRGAGKMDFSKCRPIPQSDGRSVMFDLNYFKYCFLKPSGINFDEISLEEDFGKLCKRLLKTRYDTFQYRDFQSRNIMVRDGKLFFIDFQGGRKGAPHYDLASFIWQARAAYSPELKTELVKTYIGALSEYTCVDEDEFRSDLRQFSLFRLLQVLGAYGLRGLFERKPHFIDSLPFAMDNIRELLEEPFAEYPCIGKCLLDAIPLYRHLRKEEGEKLHLLICSFSYKNGIPNDPAGNGGGYVFDCRGIPNPGRIDGYKWMTGLDAPVKDFLEKQEETGKFAELSAKMTCMHIENFIKRGFTNLMVCFGCTGGRHRSVYFAERLATDIREAYNEKVDIRLIHREQDKDTGYFR